MSASTSHAVSEEVERLRGALDAAQQSLDAILSGKVDALVVKGNGGEQVFSLLGADQPYRILLEGMSEGALTLDREGLVLFCNRCFAKMVGLPLKRVIGNKVCRWLDADNQAAFAALLASTDPHPSRGRLTLRGKGDAPVPVNLSVSKLKMPGQDDVFCVVATDMTERQSLEEMALSQKVALMDLASSKKLEQSLEESIKAVAAMVESRDQYTAGHMRRVGQLALAIAQEVGLSEDEQHGIELASTIHDVGKIGVPLEILMKPVKLTDAEYQLVKEHATIGYEILKNIEFPWPVAEMVYQHHERVDGSGYPRGLKGKETLIGAKIISVADVVESMSTNRPYRFVLGQAAALQQIRDGRGRLYDTRVVDACLRVFAERGFAFV